MRTLYKYLQILSIDVAIGASLMASLAAECVSIHLPFFFYLLLSTVVWLIYTLDHLMDAHGISEAHSDRHKFHKENMDSLVLIWALVLVGAIVGAFSLLPFEIVSGGSILACSVFLYFIITKFFNRQYVVPKEVFIAVIYTAGLIFGPAYVADFQLDIRYVLFTVQVLTLALINLLEFSLFDHDTDLLQGQHSFVTRYGKAKTHLFLKVLIVLNAGLMVSAFGYLPFYVASVLSLMGAVLISIYFWQSFFHKMNRYRVFGDMIFLFPALIWVI